jgi:murein DD-endopeptidase MepM/ murein hydrolase activator NlpD
MHSKTGTTLEKWLTLRDRVADLGDLAKARIKARLRCKGAPDHSARHRADTPDAETPISAGTAADVSFSADPPLTAPAAHADPGPGFFVPVEPFPAPDFPSVPSPTFSADLVPADTHAPANPRPDAVPSVSAVAPSAASDATTLDTEPWPDAVGVADPATHADASHPDPAAPLGVADPDALASGWAQPFPAAAPDADDLSATLGDTSAFLETVGPADPTALASSYLAAVGEPFAVTDPGAVDLSGSFDVAEPFTVGASVADMAWDTGVVSDPLDATGNTTLSDAGPASARTGGSRHGAHRVGGHRLVRTGGFIQRLRPRRKVAAIAGAGVLAVVIVTGTTTIVHNATAPTLPTSGGSAADLAARELAAQRADRSGRTAASASASASAPALASASTGTAIPTTPPAATTSAAAVPAPAATQAAEWVSPMPGVELSSCYGLRWGTVHQGIDFAGDAGTPIHAVGAGTVVAAGWLYSGYGISVVIDHGNGFLSHYAHASQALVSAGQTVKAGQTVALEGTTGDSTGPHLHFEIHQGSLWNQIDPAPWLRARGIQVGC